MGEGYHHHHGRRNLQHHHGGLSKQTSTIAICVPSACGAADVTAFSKSFLTALNVNVSLTGCGDVPASNADATTDADTNTNAATAAVTTAASLWNKASGPAA